VSTLTGGHEEAHLFAASRQLVDTLVSGLRTDDSHPSTCDR
jgi:hypothetical protein